MQPPESKSSSVTLIGEKTPELIYCDDCAARIKVVCPRAKFILFLRDPIDRAYSSWNMQVKKNNEKRSFEECINRELSEMRDAEREGRPVRKSFGDAEYQFLQRGFYMDQVLDFKIISKRVLLCTCMKIERFQIEFPDPSQLLIVISEHIRTEYIVFMKNPPYPL